MSNLIQDKLLWSELKLSISDSQKQNQDLILGINIEQFVHI
jgi:hypothetical protein